MHTARPAGNVRRVLTHKFHNTHHQIYYPQPGENGQIQVLKKKWKLANDKELSDFMYYMLCAMPVGLVSCPSVKILYSNRCFTVLQLLNFISRHNCQIYHQTSLACLNTLHSATICSNLQHA